MGLFHSSPTVFLWGGCEFFAVPKRFVQVEIPYLSPKSGVLAVFDYNVFSIKDRRDYPKNGQFEGQKRFSRTKNHRVVEKFDKKGKSSRNQACGRGLTYPYWSEITGHRRDIDAILPSSRALYRTHTPTNYSSLHEGTCSCSARSVRMIYLQAWGSQKM